MTKETGDVDERQVIRTARSNDETSYISFHLFITFIFYPYILKVDVLDVRTPQIIQIFRRNIV